MSKKVLENIAELKSRNEFANSEHLMLRLYSLEVLIKDLGQSHIKDEEISRYIPIALVACIESFFRSIYTEIIDFGEPYIQNLDKLNKAKQNIDYNMVNAIKDKKLTVGELVSYTISYNNISDIDSSLSKLLDIRFWYELKNFETGSRFDDVNITNNEFRKNYDRIKSSIVKLFELRHIFAHELGTSVKIDKTTVESLFFDTKTFLENTKEFIWFKLYPNAPETQTEMNIYAHDEFDKVNKKFKSYISLIKNQEFNDFLDFDKKLFDESILKWEEYRESEARYKSSVVEGGSMQPMLYSMSMTNITLRKIEEFEEDFPELF